MTLAYFVGRRITGTNADRTGGTWTNLPAGWRFQETDTKGNPVYYWDGSAWSLSSTIHPSIRRTGSFVGMYGAGVGCTGMMEGNGTIIAVATGGSSGVVTTAGLRHRYTSSTTINSMGGCRFNTFKPFERSLNPLLEAKIILNSPITTERAWFGWTSITTAPASAADPLANLSGVGFWYDSAVDGNWHICQNDGSASSDITTIANVATAGTTAHIFSLRAVAASNKFQYSYDGGAWTDISTKIPGANTSLGHSWYNEALAGSATRTFDVYWAWCEEDP